MIDPTVNDIGRKVVYKQGYEFREEGVITSFNMRYVFVRYGADVQSKATRREDLEWASAVPPF
jgi:hypothetical protein